MTSVQWHWMKDHDYPKNGQAVWCVIRGFCTKRYIQKRLYFSDNLYKVDEYNFSQYKKKHHKGFYNYDSEYGNYECPDVVCWCELPQLPDELRRK